MLVVRASRLASTGSGESAARSCSVPRRDTLEVVYRRVYPPCARILVG